MGNRAGLSENMVRFKLLLRQKLLLFVHFTDGMMILAGESFIFLTFHRQISKMNYRSLNPNFKSNRNV